jgi:hypothetical protein
MDLKYYPQIEPGEVWSISREEWWPISVRLFSVDPV